MRAGWAGIAPWSATGPRTMARVHVRIDDASRIAVTGSFPDKTAVSAIAALRAAVVCYKSLGITVTRVMTAPRQIAS